MEVDGLLMIPTNKKSQRVSLMGDGAEQMATQGSGRDWIWQSFFVRVPTRWQYLLCPLNWHQRPNQ